VEGCSDGVGERDQASDRPATLEIRTFKQLSFLSLSSTVFLTSIYTVFMTSEVGTAWCVQMSDFTEKCLRCVYTCRYDLIIRESYVSKGLLCYSHNRGHFCGRVFVWQTFRRMVESVKQLVRYTFFNSGH